MPWESGGNAADPQRWEDVEGLLIAYVVQAVGGAGGSVQFTVAKDLGALGVRVYDDGVKTRTVWGRVGEDIEELMFRIGDYYRQRAGEEKQRWS